MNCTRHWRERHTMDKAEEDGDPDVDEDSDVDYDNAEEELENLDEFP